uniref:Uncharacterized protein n=1 Tax=Aegilops tauschii subsp. strangulata TaxID=200361 RepID=A0A453NCT1_AEGTS
MNPPEELLPPPPPPPPPPPNRNGGNPTPPSSSLGFTFSLTEPDGGEVGPENDLRFAVCVWLAQHVMFCRKKTFRDDPVTCTLFFCGF